MTKSRSNCDRQLYGLLGSVPNGSKVQAAWNKYFHEEGIDAFMGKYPATIDTLPERLSEMFHFDRRFYIVSEKLGPSIIALLDHIDSSATEVSDVDFVLNEDGVLTGYFLGIREAEFLRQKDICYNRSTSFSS